MNREQTKTRNIDGKFIPSFLLPPVGAYASQDTRKNSVQPAGGKTISHRIRICLFCKREFELPLRNNTKKYCNHECYAKSLIGKKLSQEIRDKISFWHRGRKKPGYKPTKNIGDLTRGKKWPEERRIKFAESKKGDKTNLWRGGIDKKEYKHYRNLQYRLWREKVFRRDNYTCQECGAHSEKGKKVFLIPHHIKSYTHYPELRYVVSNGRTMCDECHKKFHWKNYKGGNSHRT